MTLEDLIKEVDERTASNQPLDRLAAAAERHRELTDEADLLLDHYVNAAREAKCSWAQIGEVLGVTKQAAQQRHSRWSGAGGFVRGLLGGRQRSGLFQRFSPRARSGVAAAQEAARSLGHDSIGTEHVLVGILGDPDSIAAKVMARWSVTGDDVLADIERRVGRGTGPAPTGHIPFTAGSKKALELALREALGLGHNYIGTEHVLLGLSRADDGLATVILADRSITPDALRTGVLEELDAYTEQKGKDQSPGEGDD
jgi:hypothetical protein